MLGFRRQTEDQEPGRCRDADAEKPERNEGRDGLAHNSEQRRLPTELRSSKINEIETKTTDDTSERAVGGFTFRWPVLFRICVRNVLGNRAIPFPAWLL